jgi:hypothetical protein
MDVLESSLPRTYIHLILFRSRRDVPGCTPFPWAARGLLAWGLGECLTRLRTLLVSFEETRVTPFFLSHPVHVASCFLFHSLDVNPPCSLRTLHFLHPLHQMTDRT